MSERAEAVMKAALQLTTAEREALAENLLSGLSVYDSPEIQKAWAKEIQRRMNEAERDPNVMTSEAQFRKNLDDILK